MKLPFSILLLILSITCYSKNNSLFSIQHLSVNYKSSPIIIPPELPGKTGGISPKNPGSTISNLQSPIFNLQSKDTTLLQVIVFKNDHYKVGRILQVTSDTTIFLYGADTMKIFNGDIVDIQNVSSAAVRYLRNSIFFWQSDKNTRLFLGPTGYTLRKKEGVLADYFFIFPYLSYGITDHITLGGGLTFLPTSDSLFNPAFYFGPKLKLWSSEIFSIAAGVFMLKIFDDTTQKYLPLIGTYYISGSFELKKFHLSTAVGNLFIGGFVIPRPIFMLAGHYQFTEKIAIITENIWVGHPALSVFGTFWSTLGIPQNNNSPDIFSIGGRYYTDQKSIGIALIFNISSSPIQTIPFVDFIYYF